MKILNNCGPSSVAEVLAFWGISRSQSPLQTVLRGDGDPAGMAPYGVPAYMRSLGMASVLGVDGSARLVKALISNGFPVIVDQYISSTNLVGHYRPIQSYDDVKRVFVSSDPYLGQNHVIGYDEFDTMWSSTNRQYILLYPPSRAALLQAVLTAGHWQRIAAFNQDLSCQRGILNGTIVDRTLEGSTKSYYLAMAWDQLQLGSLAASRQAVRQALLAGGSKVLAGWITTEIAGAVPQ